MATKTKKAPKQVDPEPFMVGLNEDQRAAFAQMTAFIFTPDSSMFCLIGPAGTGKTFLITRFIQFLHKMERREIRTQSPQRNTFLPPDIAMTAPTNKAVQVLRDSSDKSLHGKVSFDTIHSLLGLKEQINDSGEVEFRNDFNDNIRIKDKTVIVIDEVSMLHDELFYPVKNYASSKKIIFLGDACFAKDTPVILFNGSVKMIQDVTIGDVLMGPDSTPRKVLRLFTGQSPLYEIKQTNGMNYSVTPNHLVSMTRRRSISKDYNRYPNLADDIEITAEDLSNASGKFLEVFAGYRASVSYPDATLTVDPYFLGVWLGDGHKTGTILTTDDIEVLDFCRDFAKSLGLDFKQRLEHKNKTAFRINLSSYEKIRGGNHLQNSLRAIGVINNKHVPSQYRYNSEEKRLALLAGLIDTDGHYDKNGKRFVFSNTNKAIFDAAKEVAASLGFNVYDRTMPPKGNRQACFILNIAGDVWNIPTKVKRKQAPKFTPRKELSYSTLKSTPISGVSSYYGVEVDQDRRFLLSDFTVVHNCQIPPVGKEDSEPLLNPDKHQIITHRLTQIMRQREGSKIIELSMQIRESDNLSFNGFDDGDVSVMSANEERARLDANLSVIIRSPEFVANPGLMRIISWRNVKVAAYNKYVRTKLFEYAYPGVDISQRIQLCDRMITSEPYAVKLPSGDTEIRLTTNQEFTIQSILIEEQEVEHAKGSCELKFYNCIVRVFDFELQQEVEKQVSILHEGSVTEFEYQSQKLKDAAMNAPGHKRGFFWREYYQFRRTYCRCDYAYAVTCHKSQGSTYDIAIVDSNDILLNRNMKEARRILYTAVTRAKNKLILIN